MPAHAQTTYSYSDIGVFYPASPFARAWAINNAGMVLGQSRVAPSTARLLRITPVTDAQGHQIWNQDANSDGANDLMQLLPLPAGFTVSVTHGGALGAGGQAAGTAFKAPSQAPQVVIAWDAAGNPTVLTNTKYAGEGFGVNDNGDAAGWGPLAHKSAIIPYLWQYASGSYAALQLAPGGYAAAVNNLRQAVVNNNGTFLYLPSAAYGLPQGLNAISGISVVAGKNLNNSGLIAGTNAANRLCLWVPAGGGTAYGLANGLNDLGNGGFVSVGAFGINNPPAGQPLRVVGSAQDAAGNSYAFVWDSASRTIQDLNTLVTNLPAGFVLTYAYGLNDLGQIVGEGKVGGVTRGFVLTPQ
jgi:hypothetical protein